MTREPDLQRLYQQKKELDNVPVILIHGMLGARLSDQDSGKEIWFGGLRRLAFSEFTDLALDINPDTLEPLPSNLVPSGLADQAAGRDYYGHIIETLKNAGGYVTGSAGHPPSMHHREYYLFVYDWRQDNVVSARKLADLIDRIKRDHDDPDLKVDLIAHSMGGLIARYYLRYGSEDVLEDNRFPVNSSGAKNVRRVILLGTPNLGSVVSLHAFLKGSKVGLRRIPSHVLATMPSIYQLFPHALHNWLITVEGRPLERDIFDIVVWRRFQWSIFDPEVRLRVISQAASESAGIEWLKMMERYFEKRLERARRFVWSLTVPLPADSHALIVFGGDCLPTPARLLVEEVDHVSEIRLHPHEVKYPRDGINYEHLMLEPGDGTVTKGSLLARRSLDPSIQRHRYVDFPLDYSLFLCEQHDQMTGNIAFQNNLLHALLSADQRFLDKVRANAVP